MPIAKTSQDIGQLIRSQRKALGWGQDELARQIGSSRQWVIDIEKGKPRAELALVLRTLNTLGLSLNIAAPGPTPNRDDRIAARMRSPYVDIDAIAGNTSNIARRVAESMNAASPGQSNQTYPLPDAIGKDDGDPS
ncbi:MAG: helix-turn-helix transcriptional regulator [Xanthomonadales bacterium]|nr:helix-turn-helix transcriptional regulator [Xanthomonadales bacterium]